MLDKLFDKLAEDYDQMVQESDRLHLFPFAGYDDVMTNIANQVITCSHIPEVKILDLGIGTGALYQKIPPEKIHLFGVDVSEKMLELARLRLPDAKLLHHDFYKGLPEDFKSEKFDFIVSSYAFHHLDINEFVNMIEYLLKHLVPYGKILIGDILFANYSEKEICKKKSSEYWDESEYYHVFSELIELLDGHLALSFMKISYCAGILIVDNYHETALQMEDSLIKYNTNTVKWKSSQPRKKSE